MDPDNPAQNTRGGFVTCEVCNMQKYYSSHLSRRFGVYSCEACAKFFRRYLIRPKDYRCDQGGQCDLTISTPGGRCKACLLKACLTKYVVDLKRYPKIVEQNKQELVNASTDHTTSRLLANISRTSPANENGGAAATASASAISQTHTALSIKSEDPSALIDESQSSSLLPPDELMVQGDEGLDEEEDEEEDEEDSDLDPEDQDNHANISTPPRVTPLKIHLKSPDSSTPKVQRVISSMPSSSSHQVSVKKESPNPELERSPNNNSSSQPKLGVFMKRSDFQQGSLNASESDEDDDDDDDGESDDVEEGSQMEDEPMDEEEEGELPLQGEEDVEEGEVMTPQEDELGEDQDQEEQEEQVQLDPNEPELFSNEDSPPAAEEEDQGQQEKQLKSEELIQKHGTVMEAAMTRRSASTRLTSDPTAIHKQSLSITRLPAIKRTVSCRQCEGCLANDCGECPFCLDKPKFGGLGHRKQKCIQRRCTGLINNNGGGGSSGGLQVY